MKNTFNSSVKSGIFLNYSNPQRSEVWKENTAGEQKLSDVVEEYDNPLKAREIAFISLSKDEINVIAIARKSTKAATKKIRVLISEIHVLHSPIQKTEIDPYIEQQKSEWDHLWTQQSIRISANLRNSINHYLRIHRPSDHDIIKKLIDPPKDPKTQHHATIAMWEKDAIGTSLKISGINNYNESLKDWNTDLEPTDKFLAGSESVRIREDAMINTDYRRFPDWEEIEHALVNAALFTNGSRCVRIYNTNRTLLETAIGVDLIYHDLDNNSFVMVQYKRMNILIGNSPAYTFNSDKSLQKELDRMEEFMRLAQHTDSGDPEDFRINANPFYFKLCPTEQANKSGVLCSGIYLNKDYFDRIKNGAKRSISYSDPRKHITNTQFISMIQSGFFGTHLKTSSALVHIIKSSFSSGRKVVLAEAFKNSSHN